LVEDFFLIPEHNRTISIMSHPWDDSLNNLICLFPPLS
jgi:hypothetical protein